MAGVDASERADVGVDHQVDLEAGIPDANVGARALEHQPAHAHLDAACGHAAQLKADDHARLRQSRDVDAPVHRPHEQRGIQVLRRELLRRVALAPRAEALDDLTELLSRRSQPILAPPSTGQRCTATSRVIVVESA